jgi:hypothetical protein
VQHLVEETLKIYPLGFGKDLSPFQVPSSPDLDQAWEDLYNCAFSSSNHRELPFDRIILVGVSRIPKQEAAKLPNKTSPIPGDPGFYIVELDVFHELHCLVRDYIPRAPSLLMS